MEVYIEYAFLENFLFDSVLLWLSLRAALSPVRVKRIVFAATVGACFAILFPLLSLSAFWGQILKFAVGFLLCFLASPAVKNKNAGGRYALTAIFFFVFSFGFGGALLAIVANGFEKAPTFAVMIGFAFLTVISSFLVRKLYQKRAIHRFTYDCMLFYGQKQLRAIGFLDSGNLARKNGIPVCFLSPDKFYDLCEEIIWKDGGQVRDEMEISTLGGMENVSVVKGEIALFGVGNTDKREVYFACSKNMLSREYSILLSGYLCGRDEEKERDR